MKSLLEKKYQEYAVSEFIEKDPISIPHRFREPKDIEIAAFFSAILAWGRRDTMLRKLNQMMEIMNDSPYEFVMNYDESKFNEIQDFKHRTFNSIDFDFYIRALNEHYSHSDSLEDAFFPSEELTIEGSLKRFYEYFSSIVPHEQRSMKHIASPIKNSACKRLCMLMRWMVRSDEIDIGIWKKFSTSQLIVPLDVHVMNVTQKLNLLDLSDKANWKSAVKLTEKLKTYNSEDPVKYDISLFSMGNSGEIS